ncbi:hypothetical protein R1flu_008090 [Riccia fluitans]|uniref:Uncharacterized protein n=1 Tax=Riccia fluitans TaxID=41844 RepID=A0ABD1YAW6_9MARC
MVVLFENAQKQKGEFKIALLAAKEKYRLVMLEERKAAREEEMKARLAKEMFDGENAKKARLDRKNTMIFELFKAGRSTNEIRDFLSLTSFDEDPEDIPL